MKKSINDLEHLQILEKLNIIVKDQLLNVNSGAVSQIITHGGNSKPLKPIEIDEQMVITLLRQFKDAYADTRDQLPVEVYKALKISNPQQY